MVKLSESVRELSLCMTTIQIVTGTINTKSILCMISFQIIPLLPLLFSLATFLLLLFKLKLKFNTLFPYLSVFLIKQHCSTSIFYLKRHWELDKISIFLFLKFSTFPWQGDMINNMQQHIISNQDENEQEFIDTWEVN